jgi:hypothetical protein
VISWYTPPHSEWLWEDPELAPKTGPEYGALMLTGRRMHEGTPYHAAPVDVRLSILGIESKHEEMR